MTEIDINDPVFCATDTDDYGRWVSVKKDWVRREDTEAVLLDQIDLPDADGGDADALNLLGEHRSYIGQVCPKGVFFTRIQRIGTVGWEMPNSYERLTKARELAKAQVCIIERSLFRYYAPSESAGLI